MIPELLKIDDPFDYLAEKMVENLPPDEQAKFLQRWREMKKRRRGSTDADDS
jgi:hypothetical protein